MLLHFILGRGGNAWLSPIGCAVFTLHVPVPLDSPLGNAVSYLQHITSLAIVNGVCSLPGYKVCYLNSFFMNIRAKLHPLWMII